MGKTYRDRLAARAAERRQVARLNASPDADRVKRLLAGGQSCRWCGSYNVRRQPGTGLHQCQDCRTVWDDDAA